MIKKNGDLFENLTSNYIVIPHIVNNCDQMGSGFVVPLNKKWPETKTLYHKNKEFQELGKTQYIYVEDNIIVSHMCAQDNTDRTRNRLVNYGSLATCMCKIRKTIENYQTYNQQVLEIYCPAFGSGIGGGDADIIDELIESIWKDIKVTMWLI